ncbi:hypothetical protein AYL99_02469 [Fonsecaea erecta]|uniref:Sugar phosphate transporter domain-containing protein n=1 Tax=Fonsecaea erecta TaxID=1367422 RepID=A0A178ZU27_9EURO|nr:hypothetical protein AYL99_02469 [Fonsecaea erecta]OAP63242.1 hypothetical protein AYL99_02469 [Fonsecaea erecta]
MLGNGVRSSILSVWLYFTLNMVVTVTNKQIVSRTACPWLLTASHAFTTFVTTGVITRLQRPNFTSSTTSAPRSLAVAHCGRRGDNDDYDEDGGDESEHQHRGGDEIKPDLRTHLRVLLPFSILYTFNIALSNMALGLVTLTMHQTIRATTPAITVLISIAWLGRSWREYPAGAYGGIGLTICGVIIATNAASSSTDVGGGGGGGGSRSLVVDDPTRTTAFGFTITLLSAVSAVFKTIFTNELQRPPGASRWGLGLSSTRLVQYLALYAVNQTVLIASWTGEIQGLTHSTTTTTTTTLAHGSPPLTLKRGGVVLLRMSLLWPWLWLWLVNALAAALLNLASFHANRRCGPLSMAIAANMKQVVILLLRIYLRADDGGTTEMGAEEGLFFYHHHRQQPERQRQRQRQRQQRRAENTVILGSLVTAVGGIWYAFASVNLSARKGQGRSQRGDSVEVISTSSRTLEKRGWKG